MKAAKKEKQSVARRLARSYGPLFVAMLVILAARSSLADHYVVPSGSMEYTLMPGDHVLVDKTAYGLRVPFVGLEMTSGDRPARGEVVVFDSPVDGTRLIKRVVAVGGDVVVVASGHLSVNGGAVSLPNDGSTEDFDGRRALLNLSHGGGPDVGPLVVPAGQLLVMGDSRGNSHDGRMFGFISEKVVYGRALAIIYRSGSGFRWERL